MRFKLKNLLIAILCSLFFVQSVSAQFIDVVEQSLFYDAINYFTTDMPILATDRERFKPLDKVTKAEFFKLLFESAGFEKNDEKFEIPYEDVSGDEWFAFYIKEGLDLGIIQFSEFDPYFHPGNTINRCEAVKLVLDLYDINPEVVDDYTNDYYDVNEFDSCSNPSKVAYILELLHDYKTHFFYPGNELTRAEAIHIFYQIKQNDLEVISASDGEYNADFDLFFQVWDRVNSEFVDKDEIKQSDLIYGAISGMVSGLDDPYSVFFEPTEASDFFDSLEGSFDGIGIYINQEDGKFIILTPIKGSPAEAAGIKPGDIIIEVNDVLTQDLSLDDLINMLRGESGTSVKLRLKRNESYLVKTVVRSAIEIPYVESEMKNGIGIINYYQFTSNSHEQFTSEINKITALNPSGLIIDLRNNPGGYVYNAQELISRFIPEGETYVKFFMGDGTMYEEASFGPGDLKDMPVVILINEGSASASEIVALALKDKIGATIVGTESFGKEKIQEIITFSDGSTLKLSIAKWTSPNGTSVAEQGIQPDYIVELTDSGDAQLSKALQLL